MIPGRTASPPAQARSRPGSGIALDPGGKQLDDRTFFGGSPARVLRLTGAGQRALAELRDGPVRSTAARHAGPPADRRGPGPPAAARAAAPART